MLLNSNIFKLNGRYGGITLKFPADQLIVMELIDIVDKNDRIIGKKYKKDASKDGNYRRLSRIWVINPKGEILIHRRTKKKTWNVV